MVLKDSFPITVKSDIDTKKIARYNKQSGILNGRRKFCFAESIGTIYTVTMPYRYPRNVSNCADSTWTLFEP